MTICHYGMVSRITPSKSYFDAAKFRNGYFPYRVYFCTRDIFDISEQRFSSSDDCLAFITGGQLGVIELP